MRPAARDMRKDSYRAVPPPAPIPAARVLALRWPMIATLTLAFLAVGIAYIQVAPRQYRASALISIDTKADAVLRTPTEASDFNVQSANIDGQVEILQSEELVRQLADTIAEDPDFVASLQPTGLSLSALRSEAKTWLQSSAGEDSRRASVHMLQTQTSIKRVGLTHLIEISALSATPEAAAKLANAYANVFIADQLKRREDVARRTSQALQARADELQRSAQDAQNAVEQLKFGGSQQDENSAAARVRLQTLESTARAYRDVHDRFLARYVETWQQQFLSVPEAQIVSRAFPPSAKAWPREFWILSAALLLGVSLGSIMALVLRWPKSPKED